MLVFYTASIQLRHFAVQNFFLLNRCGFDWLSLTDCRKDFLRGSTALNSTLFSEKSLIFTAFDDRTQFSDLLTFPTTATFMISLGRQHNFFMVCTCNFYSRNKDVESKMTIHDYLYQGKRLATPNLLALANNGQKIDKKTSDNVRCLFFNKFSLSRVKWNLFCVHVLWIHC